MGGIGVSAANLERFGSTRSARPLADPRREPRLLEDEAPVRDRPAHADPLVDAHRRLVVGAHEETDSRDGVEQAPAEVTHAALGVPSPASGRVDPDLLELDDLWRPGRGLRLEQDRSVLGPDPGSTLRDLRPGAPAEALGIAPEGIETDLFLVRTRTCRHEQAQIVNGGVPQAGAARLRRDVERVDGLSRPILSRRGHAGLRGLPELADRAFLADHHPRPATGGGGGERVAA